MVLALKEEMIKEICCGHCHTLAINVSFADFKYIRSNYEKLSIILYL